MAAYIALSAEARTVLGKQVEQIRREGLTPIVVYGHRTEPLALQTVTKDLDRVLSEAGTSHLVALAVAGEAEPHLTLVRAVQRHVTRHTLLHADFMAVAMDETVRAEVPLELVHEPVLAAQHEAVLDFMLPRVLVEAFPADLPASVVVDTDVLEHLHQAITVADLAVGPRVRILNDPDDIVARLVPISRATEREVMEMEEAEVAAEGAPEAEAKAPVAGEAEETA